MFANNDFDVYPDFARAAENFQNASDGRETTFGITPDFDVNDCAIEFGKANAAAGERRVFGNRAQFLAQSRGQLVAGRNQNFVQDARVVREDNVSLRAVAEESDQRGMLALDNLDDTAFGAAIRSATLDTAEYAIAVHRVAEIVASDEKVTIDSADRRIGDEESVTFAMGDDSEI